MRADFVDPSDPQRPASEWAGGEIPVVELQYPGEGPGNTSERCVLCFAFRLLSLCELELSE
jgi:hypothetical protein